jgi:hypothetical protein
MSTADVSGLLPALLTDAGLPADAAREPLRVWAHSGVERLRFAGGTSVVLKYADDPFDREHLSLRLAERHDIPVPHVLAARTGQGWLAMLLDDLGEPQREAADLDGARAAAVLHQVGAAAGSWLARIDQAALEALPGQVAARLRPLELAMTIPLTQALTDAARPRAAGTLRPPYGLCHSEFHPTSLHIGPRGWHLLDFARAFTGPGLLDLASWHGTIDPPDPARTHDLIETYVAAGGEPQALTARGGLNAASWALGWHRVWVADWYASQIQRGWAAGAEDTWTTTITRHLTEATNLLNV